jgi:hypothetical protein
MSESTAAFFADDDEGPADPITRIVRALDQSDPAKWREGADPGLALLIHESGLTIVVLDNKYDSPLKPAPYVLRPMIQKLGLIGRWRVRRALLRLTARMIETKT